MNVRVQGIIPNTFLAIVAILPILSLFWEDHWNKLGFKLNWIAYPIFIIAVFVSISLRSRFRMMFIVYFAFIVFNLIITLEKEGDLEGLLRFAISLLPFVLINQFYSNHLAGDKTRFWIAYFASISVPLLFSYFQYIGKMPYYDFDSIDGVWLGRISGGYNKPMNLICFLLPIYLLAFYLVLTRGRWLAGSLIIILILIFLEIIGHRTSLIGFVLILFAAFAKTLAISMIRFYYKYYLNFLVGILSFLSFYLLYRNYGLIEALRGRIPMWQAHAEDFFTSSGVELLIGKHQILLDEKYASEKLIGSLDEAHNNTFRTIIFFGIAGYFVYCTLIRWMVLEIYERTLDKNLLFIRYSCFIFLIVYTVTNEPFYYSSIAWSILLWTVLGRANVNSLQTGR